MFHSYNSVSQHIQIFQLSLIIAPPLLPRNCFCARAHLVPVIQTSALHSTPAENELQVTNACAHQGNFRSFSSLFLFLNVQIWSGQAKSCSQRGSSSVCKWNERMHGRTYVREHMCVHVSTNRHAHTHRDIQMAYLCRIWLWWIAGKQSGQWAIFCSTTWASDALTVDPVILKSQGVGVDWLPMLTAAFFQLYPSIGKKYGWELKVLIVLLENINVDTSYATVVLLYIMQS